MYKQNYIISYKKILSHLNLDLNTKPYGSFDRYFWSWKKRDFQDSTLSFSVMPLLKIDDICKKNKNFILNIVIDNLLKIQKANGSFDQSYPNENHPKIGLDFSSCFFEYLKQNDDKIVKDAYYKLVEYSLTKEEQYGDISNHIAHHMYEYLLAYQYFNDEKYYNKAKENLDTLISTITIENWLPEYTGADAGYQTRALKYITKSIELFKDDDKKLCADLAIKSTEFLDQLILPDGTIYSMFGSRNTAILYPSGIEYMAYHYPDKFSNLCYRIRSSMKNEIAILPLQLEFDNFIRLFDDFLEAQIWYEKNKTIQVTTIPTDEFDLQEYGMKKIVKNDFQIFIHYKYGGAIVIYKDNNLFYKNGGLLIKKDSIWYGTKNILIPSAYNIENNKFVIKTEIYKSIHQEVTPFKLIILRILNLTVLRFGFVADIFRNIIVKMMISGKKDNSKNIVTREIEITYDNITISDVCDLKFIADNIYKSKYLNLFHMASSRYKHPVDNEINYYKKIKNKHKEIIELKEKHI